MRKLLSKIFAVLTAAVISVTAAVIPVSADDTKKIPNTEAMRFVDSMGAGWNLGNAFDASNCYWLDDDVDYERVWCGVRTSQALIKEVKRAGFSTIRVPVSWHNHMDPDFNINGVWMGRVKEVIDWCIAEDLYVIINVHHDVEKGYYYPSAKELEMSTKYMKSVWKQIANTFGDYSDKLIFESINEPRLAGTGYEWWYETWKVPDEVKESLDCINKLNQTFVDTIRESGGKNRTRYLLVGGYATSESNIGILSEYFKMPKDPTKDRLIADVHYYCSNLSFDKKNFNSIYDEFTSNGIPVIMSEYGLRKDYEEGYYLHDKQDVAAKKLGEIVAYARKCGITSIFWDNNSGAYDKLGFKIIDRDTAKVELPKIVEAIVENGKPALVKSSSGSSDTQSGNTTVTDTTTGTSNSSASAKSPAVTATSTKTKVQLKWNRISGATKYRVYQYKDGKLYGLKTVTGTSTSIKGLKSGRTYKFAVRAYVNGKWTKVRTSDIVKIKTKK